MERKKDRRFSGLMGFIVLMIFSYGLFSPVLANDGEVFSFEDAGFPLVYKGFSIRDGVYPITNGGLPARDAGVSPADAECFFKEAGSYAIKDFEVSPLGISTPEAPSKMYVNDSAGGNRYACRFYEAYVSGEMGPWPALMNQLKADYRQERDSDLLYDLLIAYYGYIAWLIGVEKEDRAKDYLEEARGYLETLKQDADYASYAASLRGAFLAYEIGMNRSKAVWLGPKSMKHINRAVELDAKNPIAWIEKGNAEYHMPRIFGGSYHKAAEYFHKAIQLFEKQSANLQCNWRYLNALAWLAQSYDRAGEPELALQTYRKILELEPRFEWVKDELYPAFKKEHPELSHSIPQ